MNILLCFWQLWEFHVELSIGIDIFFAEDLPGQRPGHCPWPPYTACQLQNKPHPPAAGMRVGDLHQIRSGKRLVKHS